MPPSQKEKRKQVAAAPGDKDLRSSIGLAWIHATEKRDWLTHWALSCGKGEGRLQGLEFGLLKATSVSHDDIPVHRLVRYFIRG